MVSLCQASRDSLVASSHIAKSCEDSWIYCCPGHNCKVENFFFICVLCLTETCLPNVGTTLCSLLRLCPSYNWCWNHCNNFFKPFLFCSFFFFQIKKSLNWHVFQLNRKSFFYIFWYIASAFLILLYRGGSWRTFHQRLQYGYFIWFLGEGGNSKIFLKCYLSFKK